MAEVVSSLNPPGGQIALGEREGFQCDF
jgi:hypothetical protein